MPYLKLEDFERIVFQKYPLQIETETLQNLEMSYEFLKDYAADKIIYGINTGFGPMAQFRISEENLDDLQYNLIRSHSTGTGNVLEEKYARAVVLARLNSLIQGKSGISPRTIEVLKAFLNKEIVPEIFEHGSVGASGDLVQLANLALNLIGEGHVYYKGQRQSAKLALESAGITPLKLELRDGLGLINGTSCMTGIGLVNVIQAEKLLNWTIWCSSCINEIVESFDDSISHELNQAKMHRGQIEIAQQMRAILSSSKRMQNRVEYFKDSAKRESVQFNKKIQEYYSIRCVPQILGPIKETIDSAKDVLIKELNSTNDNPIVDVASQGVYHGGNFHGDYISLEMDKLKIVMTKMIMLCERQLNFLMNPHLNQRFPAFLNSGQLGLNFGLQGLQFTATSTVAESQTLSFPNYVHSIPNNNDNQDIVSMGTNSALITKQVIENGFQVLSIHVMAVSRAMDLLSESEQKELSSTSTMVHKKIKELSPSNQHDRPLNEDLKQIQTYIKENNIAV